MSFTDNFGGYNIKRILEMSAGARVTGIDISEESVKKARKINKSEIGNRCKVQLGSVEKMLFEDSQFDFVTAFETVFFWPDLKENIKEVIQEPIREEKKVSQVLVIEENEQQQTETQQQIQEYQQYQESVMFDSKPSLWQRFKKSKFARAFTYVFRIRIRVELPNALPEGRGE